jgi:hypothetical protein
MRIKPDKSRRRRFSFVSQGLVVNCRSSSVPREVVVMMARVSGRLLLASLINCGALSNAVVVALPYNVGVGREGKQTLDRLPTQSESHRPCPTKHEA